ncbi:hypothetical protein M7I_3661 [Glarea lozoyensis 74030]|uniref:Uncharacterized protein n=1 Tax=Glarea lozoyensis (strain ATCC 74030 / MF5533) TaxID=1104152 RepID=H0EM35_GLAL7|nr:hypothetical protein M7I_3661 [Glarea lozoyensis 74030]
MMNILTHNHGWFGVFSLANTLLAPEDVYISKLRGGYESLNAGVRTIVEYAKKRKQQLQEHTT